MSSRGRGGTGWSQGGGEEEVEELLYSLADVLSVQRSNKKR